MLWFRCFVACGASGFGLVFGWVWLAGFRAYCGFGTVPGWVFVVFCVTEWLLCFLILCGFATLCWLLTLFVLRFGCGLLVFWVSVGFVFGGLGFVAFWGLWCFGLLCLYGVVIVLGFLFVLGLCRGYFVVGYGCILWVLCFVCVLISVVCCFWVVVSVWCFCLELDWFVQLCLYCLVADCLVCCGFDVVADALLG